jgi:hypothetical protein
MPTMKPSSSTSMMPLFFPNSEVSLERHIQIAQTWPDDYVASGIAKGKRRGPHESRIIEPA